MQQKVFLAAIILLLSITKIKAQNVGIGTSSPNASAKLEISDANRGFLPPRVALVATNNTTTPIASPATGLMVYNTATAGSGTTAVSPGFYYFDGTQWVRMIAPTNTNTLTSATNTLTSIVNGVTATANAINTNATSLSGTNLTTTVNGVASTALDLSPAITSSAWSKTGNSGTTAGTNFIGTTDATDFVTKTNSTEAMRIANGGNVGIGTTLPGSKLDVKGTLRLSGSTSGYVGFAPASAAGSTTYTLPTADGTSGQVLKTDGSGNLSWTSGNARSFTATITAGNMQPFARYNYTEGSISLMVQVQSPTSGNSGTKLYLFQGGYNQVTPMSSWFKMQPITDGRGHGDFPSGFDLYVRMNPDAYTYEFGVGVPTNTHSIRATFNDMTNGSMTFTDISANAAVAISSAGDVYSLKNVNAQGVLKLGGATSGYVGLQAPSAAGSTTYTLPSADGSSGQALVTNGSGTLSWGAPTSSVWNQTGNSGTTAGTNFIGTTDATDFVTKTNSTEAMRVANGGNVGIGTTSPGSKLDVKGTLRLSGSSSGYVGFAPAATAGSTTYTLPNADGTSGQVLSTNGSGTLSWASTTARSFSSSVSAGNMQPMARYNYTEGIVSLLIEVQSPTGGNSGTKLYLFQGGYSSLSALNTWYKMQPISDGRGHGDFPSGFDLYVQMSTAYTYDFAVGATSNTHTLRATFNDLTNGSMTFTDISANAAVAISSGGDVYSIKNMNIQNNVGIGLTSPSDKLDVNGNIRLEGSTSGYTALKSAAAPTSSVTYTLPTADGTNGQALVTNGSGILSWGSSNNRSFSASVTAGNMQPMARYNYTEGSVSLMIEVQSPTGGNSGTKLYLFQGGYSQLASLGSWYKMQPISDGRGHGDFPSGFDLYVRMNPDAYTYEFAVGATSNTHTLRATFNDLTNGSMTFTDISANAAVAISSAGDVYSIKNMNVQSNIGIGTTSPSEALEVSGNIKSKHIVGSTTAPTISAGSAAGSSPTISLSGSDVAGKITLTTGTTPSTNNNVFTVSFNTNYSTSPYVILTPGNAATAALSAVAGGNPFVTSTATSNFIVAQDASALAASTTYVWYYQVIQ